MSAATGTGASAPATAWSRTIAPAVTAMLVGLLVAGTLGTVSAIIVGTGLHLLGLPDVWALAAAIVTVAASLFPSAALACRTWQVERDGIDA